MATTRSRRPLDSNVWPPRSNRNVDSLTAGRSRGTSRGRLRFRPFTDTSRFGGRYVSARTKVATGLAISIQKEDIRTIDAFNRFIQKATIASSEFVIIGRAKKKLAQHFIFSRLLAQITLCSIIYYRIYCESETMPEALSSENQIVAAIRRIIRAVDLHSRRLMDEHGLTGPQLAVLREAARLGTARISALARSVHLSQPTVTGILDRLERRDLVERSRGGDDRRTVNISVTVNGHKLLNRAPSLLQDRFRRELAKLRDWERTMTLATLQRIAEMMEADTLEASPVLVAGPLEAEPAAAARPPTVEDLGTIAPPLYERSIEQRSTKPKEVPN